MKGKKIRNTTIVTILLVAASLIIVSQLAFVNADQPDQPVLPAGENPTDILPVQDDNNTITHVTIIEETINDEGQKKLAASLAIGIAGFGAAIAMGQAGSAAIGAISEKPELFGKTIIFVVFIEAVAIYALLISILIVFNI